MIQDARGLLEVRDLRELIKNIARIYIEEEDPPDPYPVIRFAGKTYRGYEITGDNLKTFKPQPHWNRVAAIDASVKVLFNCGSYKILVSKVAWGFWRGYFREKTGIFPIRTKIVWDKVEAAEWLLKIELEAALKVLEELEADDILLLDRSLAVIPVFKKKTRLLMEELARKAGNKDVILAGIVKSSKLKLNTGGSLIGHLIYLAALEGVEEPWYYYPLFDTLPTWYYGDIVVAKLDPYADEAFRIDVSFYSLIGRRIREVLGKIAYTQDPATPGYPYPLISVHKLSLFADEELERIREKVSAFLQDAGVLNKFMKTVRSSTFKERKLWGITG